MSRTINLHPFAGRRTIGESGFTLIELMVANAILVILVFVAVPAMSAFINENRQTASINLLLNSMNFARTEAIKRSVRILVCPSTGCGSISASSWQNGWQICYDANGDNACDTTTTSNPNPIRTGKVKYGSQILVGPAALVSFNPMGASNGMATFELTNNVSGVKKRVCTVIPAGVVQTSKG